MLSIWREFPDFLHVIHGTLDFIEVLAKITGIGHDVEHLSSENIP